MTDKVPAVRIMVYSPQRTCWSVHKVVTSKAALDRELCGLCGRKVRLIRTETVAPPAVKPPYVSPSTEHREQVAQRMIELADANKRYKSPG